MHRLPSWRVAVVLAASCQVSAFAQTKAFPEAEGFGRFATGARQNLGAATVYHVTNLNDSGPGSFRDAVSAGNRFIVFDVAGVITLNSAVSVDKDNLYIAGQTSPGGITFYGDKVSFSGADNLISRYIAIRKGEAGTRQDASGLSRGSNMIFDHMSVTWGVDETFSMNPETGQTIDNITIQNTIIAQGLDRLGHSAGGLMTIGEGNRFSIIKSLFADSVTRNPKVRGENEFINNIVYGWETAAYIMGDTTATSHANAIGNYFIEGPVDGGAPFTSGTSSFHIYGSDNWVDGNRNGTLDGVPVVSYPGSSVVATPFAFPTVPAMTAQETLPYVLKNVGVSNVRDAVDSRIVQEVASLGTLGGVIDRETDLFPGYDTNPAPYVNVRARLTDGDGDGIADNWETAHGLNPSNGSDWKALTAAGYTRLEEYLNELGGNGATMTSTGGIWTSAATWAGAAPTLADDAVAAGTLNVASGNAFARRLTLTGNLNVTGGTLDVFDTVAVNGSIAISGGAMTAGQVLLGSTGQSGALALTGGTLQTGTIGSSGGTASLHLNGGTIRFTGTPNVAVATTVGAGGATLDTNGFSGSITGGLWGAGTLTKTGSGTLMLGGNNAGYSGGINLNAGAITLATTGANSSTGTITAAHGTQLNVNTSGASTPLALASGAAVNLVPSGGLTYAGAITGPAGTTLVVTSSSSGTSNFSLGGNLSNFAGTIDLASSSGNVRMNQGGSALASFDVGDSTGVLRPAFDGTVNLGSLAGGAGTKLQGSTNGTASNTFVIGANGRSTTFAGTITNGANATTPGVSHVTKTGAGVLTLSNAASTYTGATTINGGTLSVSTLANGGLGSGIGQSSNDVANLVLDGGALRYTGATISTDRLFTLGAAGGTLDASGAGTLTINGIGAVAMDGSGDRALTLRGSNTGFNNFHLDLADPAVGKTSLTKDGSGTWRLFGAQKTYSGDTTVKAGTLYLVSAGVLPWGAGKGDVIIDAGATLDMYGSSHAMNGLSGGGGTITTTLNTTRTLTVGNNDASGSFAGVLTNGISQTLNLTKTGAGTQVLSGANTYAGKTTVNGGLLVVNGTHMGGGDYTINSGGMLGGAGSIGSAVTVNAGGAIVPGNSPGALSLGGVTLTAGADFVVELAGPTSYDQLDVTGTVSVGSANLLVSLSFVPDLGDTLYIVRNDGLDAIGGTFAGLAEAAVIDLISSADQQPYAFRISYTANAEMALPAGGNDIALIAVPEPSAASALVLATMAGVLARRRDRRS